MGSYLLCQLSFVLARASKVPAISHSIRYRLSDSLVGVAIYASCELAKEVDVNISIQTGQLTTTALGCTKQY